MLMQLALFFLVAILFFLFIAGWSNWRVSGKPFRFENSGRHDIACYFIFLGASLIASGIVVLFWNLFSYFF
jgi:hypothetical protein